MKDQTLTRTLVRTNPLGRISPRLILIRLSLACVIAVFICGAASAQIKFVQITDLHLYDDGEEASENKRTFRACLTKIDKLIESGADFKFVVVTGDIGIEKLVKPSYDKRREIKEMLEEGKLDQKQAANKKEEIARLERDIELKIEGAALEVANMIGNSKVKVWLFVPGNNDLIDEWTNTIEHYQNFAQQLRQALPGKQFRNLGSDDLAEGVYAPTGGFVFIGFDDGSFKNNNDAKRISNGTNTAAIVARTDSPKCGQLPATEKAETASDASISDPWAITKTTAEQLKYVQRVIDRLILYKGRPAYIFYHIPEIDDPHPILNFDLGLLNDRRLRRSDKYAYSSWFVDGCVRARWAKVVGNNDVKGLFAGHLHDWRRETYDNFRWMITPDYPGGTLNKLHVCPPLAIKRQTDQSTQSRGFQTVSIDGTGKVSVNVFWYDAATGTFQSAGEAQLGLISRAWRVFSSFVGFVWGTIPSYLPFYLLVVVVLYAVVKGSKRATVVSPFHMPSSMQIPFGGHTVANVLRDTLVEIHQRANQGPGDQGQIAGGLMTPKLEGMKFSEAASFQVPDQYAVEVKGLSRDAIISFARKILGREWIISGDVIGDTTSLCVLARRGTQLWSSGSNPATMDGLHKACREIALRMMGAVDATLLEAYTTLRASDLTGQNKLDEVLELMKEAARLLPKNALIAYDLGVTHAKKGENREAIVSFEKALQLDSNFPEALNNLGVALVDEGELDRAIDSYEKALSMRPEYPAVLYNLGDALYEKGRYSEAIDKYEKALKLQPNDSDILFNLGVALFYNGQYAEAIKRYEEVLQITPGDPEVLHHLGMSLFKYGKKSEAIDVVRQAQSARPQDKDIQKTLSEMLKAVGEELE